MVIDAWMQHGTVRFLQHEMLDSLWRWLGQKPPAEELPVQTTVDAMDAGEWTSASSAPGTGRRATWSATTRSLRS